MGGVRVTKSLLLQEKKPTLGVFAKLKIFPWLVVLIPEASKRK